MLLKPVIVFFLLVLFLLVPGTISQTISYSDNIYPQGLLLQKQTAQGVTLTFSTSRFDLENVSVMGKERKAVHLPSVFLPNEAGFPDVPALSATIAVPKGARPVLHFETKHKTVMENLDIAPAPVLPKETESGALRYEENLLVYTTNAFYPASPVQISEVTDMRGMDVIMLSVCPFQYNPVTKQLIVHKDIAVSISFEGGNNVFGDERLRSIWWEPVYKQNIMNYASIPAASAKKYNPESLTPDYEYLIITPDNPVFLAWADTLKNWRTKQGIRTGVVTLSAISGNDTTKIRNYIKTAYTTWAVPPVAVLFLGDYSTGTVTGNGVNSPIYNNYCASDNKYVDMNYDHLPEMAVGRISAQDNTQLQTIIGKMLNYERNPVTNADFYKKPIIAGGWQTERWFILCLDVIYGYMKNKQAKVPTREYAIYSGTPGTAWSSNQNTNVVVNYFGPNGLNYIPATPAHLTDWNGNATRINNDINAGAFILQHRDHGMETGWGEPSYTSTNVASLNNSMLPFVFSLNCLTGKFNYSSNCFTESFTRHAKGALGAIGASEVSYSFVNDAYTWGMYDYMFPDFDPGYGQTTALNLLPAFANSAGKYYLKASSWPYNTSNKVVTYHLFHHFGDVFMRIGSEVPQVLSVAHDTSIQAGDNSYCMAGPAGALMCISKNGQIVETAIGTGDTTCFNIGNPQPRDIYEITVTKQNYYRYSALVKVYGDPLPVHVVYPNGGETLRAGMTKNIIWESVLTGKVKLDYSTDNGTTWILVADSVNASALNYSWIVPNTPATGCKIRICDCSNPATNDISDLAFTIAAQYCTDVTAAAEWNLIAAPVAAVNMSATALFPSTNSPAYGFSGSYQPAAALVNGAGYWMRFPSACTQTQCGEPLLANTIPVVAGWNIIGVFNQSIPATGITSSPAGILNSGFFGYSNGYALYSTLVPGKGYWVRATQAGVLNLSATDQIAKSSNVGEFPYLNKIAISDKAGNHQELFIVAKQQPSALPPLPPAGVFDTRFTSGNFAETSENTVVSISGAVYPVTLSLTGPAAAIQDAATHGKMFFADVVSGQQISITNPAISQLEVIQSTKGISYQLLQNYPNPFNPSTDIGFMLPEKTQVRVAVYNQLGEQIAVLVNEEREAGYHSVTWNAASAATGIYFYSIKTPSFSAVKKLVFMK